MANRTYCDCGEKNWSCLQDCERCGRPVCDLCAGLDVTNRKSPSGCDLFCKECCEKLAAETRTELIASVREEAERLGWSDEDALLLCAADGVIPEVTSFDQLTGEQLEDLAEHLYGAEPAEVEE